MFVSHHSPNLFPDLPLSSSLSKPFESIHLSRQNANADLNPATVISISTISMNPEASYSVSSERLIVGHVVLIPKDVLVASTDRNMWKFKPFAQKEPAGLEGQYLEIGSLKVQVRNVIAEGGFSSVYSAQDTSHPSKQYALKHMICNDDESLELVMKEISVLKSLRGHPNVVTPYAHGILDMGTGKKEALLAMEFCGKSLVEVLESRGGGAGY
ncbi:hypothetical protein F2Q70_00025233 [Brassica cretica]|uniref:Protein kinase domain-containing protein n=1 Tax=Brassica cretica TaxID=69181 RepID=A0A8S9L873_BRACR|nr:hypothetical protein F2Q70_00025233 [Brassica cretica]